MVRHTRNWLIRWKHCARETCMQVSVNLLSFKIQCIVVVVVVVFVAVFHNNRQGERMHYVQNSHLGNAVAICTV